MDQMEARMDRLTEEQEELILKQVGYSKQQLAVDLKQLREWLNAQQYLPPSRLKETDSFLELYLTGCKGSLEGAKRKLDNYYTFRRFSEICDNRDPTTPQYLSAIQFCQFAVLPHVGVDGTRTSIGTFADVNPGDFDFLNFSRYIINRTEMCLRAQQLSSSNILIFDCHGASPSLVLKMRPTLIKDMIFVMQDMIPIRFKKISFINTPTYMEIAVNNIVKPFLSKKLQERLHVTSGDHDLLNYFSPSQLPRDYGGLSTNPSLKEYSDLWSKCEQDYKSWFINELSELTDESKRSNTENDITKNSYFGVHGSLKKLVID